MTTGPDGPDRTVGAVVVRPSSCAQRRALGAGWTHPRGPPVRTPGMETLIVIGLLGDSSPGSRRASCPCCPSSSSQAACRARARGDAVGHRGDRDGRCLPRAVRGRPRRGPRRRSPGRGATRPGRHGRRAGGRRSPGGHGSADTRRDARPGSVDGRGRRACRPGRRRAGARVPAVARRSWRPYLVIAGLVLSFSVFTLLGSLLLTALRLPQDLLRWAGIVLLVAIGVGMIVPRVEEVLERPFRRIAALGARRGAARQDRGAFVLGLGLGVLYVPCAGPVLAAITVAGATGNIGPGTVALTVSFAVRAAIRSWSSRSRAPRRGAGPRVPAAHARHPRHGRRRDDRARGRARAQPPRRPPAGPARLHGRAPAAGRRERRGARGARPRRARHRREP